MELSLPPLFLPLWGLCPLVEYQSEKLEEVWTRTTSVIWELNSILGYLT